MSNILAVKIKGFQSHTDSSFNLCSGLNVITGQSDAGKTAIIRAVRWVAFNEPQGESFITSIKDERTGDVLKQADEAEVTIELDNGVTITKTRRKGKTSYKLSTYTEPFEKAEVPQEVAEALGVHRQNFGDFITALNFAYQLEAPFLLSESNSAGAKVLGKLAGTEVVDLAIKATAKDTYAARQEKLQAEKELARIAGDLLSYHDLDDQIAQLNTCESALHHIEQASARIDKLNAWKKQIETLDANLEKSSQKLQVLKDVPQLIAQLADVEASNAASEKLENQYAQLYRLTQVLYKAVKELEDLKTIPTLIDAANDIDEAYSRLNRLLCANKTYTGFTNDLEKINSVLAATEKVAKLDKAILNLSIDEKRQQNLSEILKAYTYVKKNLNALNWVLERLKGIDEKTQQLQGFEASINKITNLRLLNGTYLNKYETVRSFDMLITSESERIDHLTKELAELWQGIDICPLCEQPISKGATA